MLRTQHNPLILTDILFTMRKQALLIHNDQAASFALTPPVGGLVLLAISRSGETRFIRRAIVEAKKAGVKSIGLTNEPARELARVVDVPIATQTLERANGSFAIAPRICQLAAAVLIMAVCVSSSLTLSGQFVELF